MSVEEVSDAWQGALCGTQGSWKIAGLASSLRNGYGEAELRQHMWLAYNPEYLTPGQSMLKIKIHTGPARRTNRSDDDFFRVGLEVINLALASFTDSTTI